MIQFNLLPDVKIQYIKARRMKRTVIVASVIVIASCAAVLALLASAVYGLQRNHIANLSEDIERDISAVQEVQDINRVLTVQNQLGTIDSLHEAKPVTSRLFDFIESITPSDVSINSVEVDYANDSIFVSGEANNLATVNKFVDTIKFTTYVIATDEDENNNSNNDDNSLAFSNVVLSSFGRTNDETSYTIDLTFNPIIFDSSEDIRLEVQQRITTRSEVERPQALFRTPEEDNNAQEN